MNQTVHSDWAVALYYGNDPKWSESNYSNWAMCDSQAWVSPNSSTIGSCSPKTATVEVNNSTQWIFMPNMAEGTMMEFLGATYSWTFYDGDSIYSSTGMTSNSIYYTSPGIKQALLKVTIGQRTEDLLCSPLTIE